MDLPKETETPESSGKKRRREIGPMSRITNKMLRMKGLPYLGLQRTTTETLIINESTDGKPTPAMIHAIPRKGRQLGPPCVPHQGKSYFQCRHFSQELRQKYFDTFWQEMNWEERKSYIKSLVEVKPVKAHRKRDSRRTEAPVYSLKTEDGTKLRVCKPFFLSTFSLGKQMVDGWFKDPKPSSERSYRKEPSPKPVEIKIDSKDKRLRQKILRMKGLPYLGVQMNAQTEIEPGQKRVSKFVLAKPKQGRIMGPPCELHKSSKSSFQCHEFPDRVRKRFFASFWQDMNWEQRKYYVRSLVTMKPVKAHAKNKDTVRSDVVYYHLKSPLDDTLLRVCKPFFLSTFGVGKQMVVHWCKGSSKAEATKKESSDAPEPVIFAQQFLSLLPKHCCQKSVSKLILEPMITAKIQLYRIYKDYCDNSGQPCISITKFKGVFEEMNLSLLCPKKDVCDLCEKYKEGEVGEDVYKAHLMKKERAGAEKKFDKEQCVKGLYNGITVDLQTVKQAPFLPLQSSIYFKAKLNVYSYTVYNLGNDKVRCYWWDETQGDLVSSSFVSCLLDYLETFNHDNRPIVIFSDGCGYQNRNIVMSNALLNFAMQKRKIIYQKFIEKEHNQTECDSVHTDFERKLKDVNIRLPNDYLDICRSARRHPTSRYEAKELDYMFFRDYTCKLYQRYESIRPGSKPKDPHETDIQALKYDPNGLIFFKIHFDDDWKLLPRKPRQLLIQETAPPLFQTQIKLDFKKYSDLQDLKQLLPEECHEFYDSLPHEPFHVSVQSYPTQNLTPSEPDLSVPEVDLSSEPDVQADAAALVNVLVQDEPESSPDEESFKVHQDVPESSEPQGGSEMDPYHQSITNQSRFAEGGLPATPANTLCHSILGSYPLIHHAYMPNLSSQDDLPTSDPEIM